VEKIALGTVRRRRGVARGYSGAAASIPAIDKINPRATQTSSGQINENMRASRRCGPASPGSADRGCAR